MDPQELARIERNLRRIIDAGGPESDVLAYLRTEGFNSREEYLDATRPPVDTGPTPQPPPGSGVTDFLNAAALPIVESVTRAFGPRDPDALAPGQRRSLSDISAQLEELEERSGTAAAAAAAVPFVPVGAGFGRTLASRQAAKQAASRAMERAANPWGFRIHDPPPPPPGMMQRGTGLVKDIIGSRLGRTARTVGLYELLRRQLTGRN